MNLQPHGRLAPQRNFRAIHLEDARIAAGGAQTGRDSRSGKETELHQAPGIFARKIDVIEDRRVAAPQIDQSRRRDLHLGRVATQLHLGFSMRRSEILVNTSAGFSTPF